MIDTRYSACLLKLFSCFIILPTFFDTHILSAHKSVFDTSHNYALVLPKKLLGPAKLTGDTLHAHNETHTKTAVVSRHIHTLIREKKSEPLNLASTHVTDDPWFELTK